MLFAAPALTAPPQNDSDSAGARGVQQRYDLALSQSLSRQRVPFGGTVTEVLKVTNRGTVTVPTSRNPELSFGQEINIPGSSSAPGKAVYQYVRSPGADCTKGTLSPSSRVQSFACLVTRLAPGQSQTVAIKIKNIKGPLMLSAYGFYGASGRVNDDNRANDEVEAVVRVQRRR